MALPATAVGEVQTGGSDTQCSGFFNSARGGTDYTQQTTAQATGTVTSATTTVTATASIFTAAMVGNYITDGTTYKEITAFTSGTIVTVDSAPSWTAATIYVGGAMASPGKASGIAVSGNTVWIRGGTYSITSTTNNVAGGRLTTTGGTLTRGYATTRGDDGTAPVLQASSISTATICTANGTIWNLTVDGASLTAIQGFSSTSGGGEYAYKCWAKNCTNNGFSTAAFCPLIYCRASGCSTAAAFGSCYTFNCLADGNSAGGFTFGNNTGISAVSCIASGNTGIGFSLGQGGIFSGCTAYGNTSDGFKYNNVNAGRTQIIGSLSVGNGGWGINVGGGTTTPALVIACATYNNTSGAINGTSATSFGNIALSSDPFVASGSGNFALNNTAGAGASCRAAGIPGVFPGGATTGYLDIGAVQHQDSGGSSTPATPNFSGGFEN